MNIYQILREHLEKQPYTAKCLTCGDMVHTRTEVDNDGDLLVEVVPCKRCIEDAEDAVERGERRIEDDEDAVERGK